MVHTISLFERRSQVTIQVGDHLSAFIPASGATAFASDCFQGFRSRDRLPYEIYHIAIGFGAQLRGLRTGCAMPIVYLIVKCTISTCSVEEQDREKGPSKLVEAVPRCRRHVPATKGRPKPNVASGPRFGCLDV